MDILEQYNKQSPAHEEIPENAYEDSGQNDGPIIRWAIKISQGRICNARQANIVLLATAICLISITGILLARGIFISSVDPETFKNKTRAPEIISK